MLDMKSLRKYCYHEAFLFFNVTDGKSYAPIVSLSLTSVQV